MSPDFAVSNDMGNSHRNDGRRRRGDEDDTVLDAQEISSVTSQDQGRCEGVYVLMWLSCDVYKVCTVSSKNTLAV